MVRRRPLVLIACVFIAGIFFARSLESSASELVWLCFASGTFLLAILSWWVCYRIGSCRILVYISTLVSFFFLGAFVYAHSRLPTSLLYPKLIQLKVTRGVVVSYPITRLDRTSFVLKPHGAPGYFQVFYFHRQRTNAVPISYGDLFVLDAPVKEPPLLEAFDYREYLRQRDIWGVISIYDESQIQKLAHSQGFWFLQVGYELRRRVVSVIDKHVSLKEASLLKGLLLGDTSDLSPETFSDFQDAGVLHVLAVSGANLGMILFFLWTFVRLFGASYTRLYLIASPITILYLWVVGFEISLVRASLIFFFTTIGLLCAERGWILKRWADPLQGLAAAALVLLGFAPESLFDVSFQLSFAATGAILLAVLYLWPWLAKKLQPRDRSTTEQTSHWKWSVLRWLINFVLVSVAAQTGVAPFLAYHFERLYGPISLLANLVIVPLVTIALWGGILILILALLPLTNLAEWLGFAESVLLSWILQLTEFFASLPGAYWSL
jgi:competence protein ComEC